MGVTYLTDALAIAPHPSKGNCLFACRDIKEGEVIMHTKLDELVHIRHTSCTDLDAYLKTLPDLEAQQKVLIHTVPGPVGTILTLKGDDMHVFFNHSRPPYARHYNDYYAKPEWD